MTSNRYIIDTSSLIELNKHNPRDVYPGVWNKIERLIDLSRLIAPKEVLNEIKQIDDSLSKWAKTQNKMFIEPTIRQIEIVKEILNKYPSLIKTERKFDADPWVIALAIESRTQKQRTLLTVKRIVVSEEKLRGERVKIPFVCEKMEIESMDIIDMFRTEGWTF